jgi:hypothetical protein
MDENWENEEFSALMAESKYNDLLNAGIQWSYGGSEAGDTDHEIDEEKLTTVIKTVFAEERKRMVKSLTAERRLMTISFEK